MNSRIFLHGLKRTTKTLTAIACVQAKIRNRDHPNTWSERSLLRRHVKPTRTAWLRENTKDVNQGALQACRDSNRILPDTTSSNASSHSESVQFPVSCNRLWLRWKLLLNFKSNNKDSRCNTPDVLLHWG
jgi:hypothetical protein